jgi:hypothetical protein
MGQVAAGVTDVSLGGIGHYAAMEAPERLAEAMLAFYASRATQTDLISV